MVFFEEESAENLLSMRLSKRAITSSPVYRSKGKILENLVFIGFQDFLLFYHRQSEKNDIYKSKKTRYMRPRSGDESYSPAGKGW